MSEREKSRKVRKTESPKVVKKSEVGSPKSEEENTSAFKIPQSEIINKSLPAGQAGEIENPSLPAGKATSEIKTMEVHHHPQLDHKPKPWKEYLLEGLMIFLAVFMGFIAESLREHIGDRERETLYMESLVKTFRWTLRF